MTDPAAMPPSERRREVAAILAKGVLRLRQCRENPPDSQPSRALEKPLEFSPNRLDSGTKTSPRVPAR